MTHPPTFTNTWPQAPQPVDFNCCCLKPAMVDLWPELRLATCTRKPAAAGGGGQTRGGSPCREWCLPTKQTDWCTSGSHDQTLDWGLYAFEFVKKFQTERLASFQTQNETISAKTNIFWVEINAKVELCLNKQMMSIYMNLSKKPTQFRLSTKPTNIYKYQLKLLSSRHSQPALISISR